MEVGRQCLLRSGDERRCAVQGNLEARPEEKITDTDVRGGPEGVRLHAPEILHCVYHHAGTDRDQQDIVRNAHIAMSRTESR